MWVRGMVPFDPSHLAIPYWSGFAEVRIWVRGASALHPSNHLSHSETLFPWTSRSHSRGMRGMILYRHVEEWIRTRSGRSCRRRWPRFHPSHLSHRSRCSSARADQLRGMLRRSLASLAVLGTADRSLPGTRIRDPSAELDPLPNSTTTAIQADRGTETQTTRCPMTRTRRRSRTSFDFAGAEDYPPPLRGRPAGMHPRRPQEDRCWRPRRPDAYRGRRSRGCSRTHRTALVREGQGGHEWAVPSPAKGRATG